MAKQSPALVSDRTPPLIERAGVTILPSTHAEAPKATRSFRGLASETEYLNALKAFLDDQKCWSPTTSVLGFYDSETMEELASQ